MTQTSYSNLAKTIAQALSTTGDLPAKPQATEAAAIDAFNQAISTARHQFDNDPSKLACFIKAILGDYQFDLTDRSKFSDDWYAMAWWSDDLSEYTTYLANGITNLPDHVAGIAAYYQAHQPDFETMSVTDIENTSDDIYNSKFGPDLEWTPTPTTNH